MKAVLRVPKRAQLPKRQRDNTFKHVSSRLFVLKNLSNYPKLYFIFKNIWAPGPQGYDALRRSLKFTYDDRWGGRENIDFPNKSLFSWSRVRILQITILLVTDKYRNLDASLGIGCLVKRMECHCAWLRMKRHRGTHSLTVLSGAAPQFPVGLTLHPNASRYCCCTPVLCLVLYQVPSLCTSSYHHGSRVRAEPFVSPFAVEETKREKGPEVTQMTWWK